MSHKLESLKDEPRIYKFYEGDVIGKDIQFVEHSAFVALQEKLRIAQDELLAWRVSNLGQALIKANQKLRIATELLHTRRWHDDDCADQKEKFKDGETCECGAESIKQFLGKLEAIK